MILMLYLLYKGFPKKNFSTFGPAVYRQIHIHERRALLSRRLAEVPSVARGIFKKSNFEKRFRLKNDF